MAAGDDVSVLGEELANYLARRRRLGFVVRHDEDTLRSFVRFCDNARITTITTTTIVEWVTAAVGVQSSWLAKRFGVVRLFAQHLHISDPVHEVPPARLIVGHYERVVPYLYSDADIDALMTSASQLSGHVRPVAYQTLIGLLAATGMRISEALALDNEHVNLNDGLITVRNTKFNKSRQLPLHPTTTDALNRYVVARTPSHGVDRAVNRAGDEQPLFITDTGRRIHYRQCQATFARCLADAGVSARPGRRPPRLHDIRHTFAVNTLIGWYSNGINVTVSLPYLSTYLGHINPAATYWYFTGSPELAGVIAGRLDTITSTVRP